MLLDWLVVGQVLAVNPAHAVRGPKYVVRRGKTPVLSEEQARRLIESIDTSTVVGLRDRALIGVMTYAELPPNWWTPLLSSDGSGKVSNGPGTASVYAENMRLWTGTNLATGGRVGLCAACSIDSSRVSGSPP